MDWSFGTLSTPAGFDPNVFAGPAIAGMMAGAVFNLLLYYTRSISQWILAHAVANLALGIYVLQTGQWRFW